MKNNKKTEKMEDDLYLDLLDKRATKMLAAENNFYKNDPKNYSILSLNVRHSDDSYGWDTSAALIHQNGFNELNLNSALITARGIHAMNDMPSQSLQDFQERIYHYLIRYDSGFDIFNRHVIEVVLSKGFIDMQLHKSEKNQDYLNRNIKIENCNQDTKKLEIVVLNSDKTDASRAYFDLGRVSIDKIFELIQKNDKRENENPDLYLRQLTQNLKEHDVLIYATYSIDFNSDALDEFINSFCSV